MHNFMKPLLLAGLLAGAASASPMWASHDDPSVIREELRGHQAAYSTAVSNRNFDRARYERDRIEITQGKLNQAEFAARWDMENSEDYNLMMRQDSDNYYLRTTSTSQGATMMMPDMRRVWDPMTETYHFVRINP